MQQTVMKTIQRLARLSASLSCPKTKRATDTTY